MKNRHPAQKKEINIVFFGNYHQVLSEIYNHFRVALAVTQTNKENSGISEFCDRNNIPLLQIETLDEIQSTVLSIPKPVAIAASFGLLFKQRHISLFLNVFNIHPGCIFSNRGRHPLPNAIKHGMPTMSISAHEILDEEIDAGHFLCRIEMPINYKQSYKDNEAELLACLPQITSILCHKMVSDTVGEYLLKSSPDTYFPPLDSQELKRIIEATCLISWKP